MSDDPESPEAVYTVQMGPGGAWPLRGRRLEAEGSGGGDAGGGDWLSLCLDLVTRPGSPGESGSPGSPGGD